MNVYFELLILTSYLLACLEIFTGYLKKNPKLLKIGNITLFLGFFLHTLNLLNYVYFSTLYHSYIPNSIYFNFLGWIILLILLILWLKLKLNFLFLLGAPLTLLFYSSSLIIRLKLKKMLTVQTLNFWFGLHLFTLFSSLALLALAFGSGLIYLYLENKIKTKSKLPKFSNDFPSLNFFDHLNHIAIIYGFPLFSLGVFTGFIWATLSWKKVFIWNLKEIFALIIWIFFAYLFHQRVALGWKGKSMAQLTIWLFIIFVISFVGISLFAQIKQ
ncbi:MAG: cytochrome c biogenesis protein CcsA [Desulfonauticus sp.]|nr:cytochrome c biogenesis protein CcsA [Desulfonauticus sp.]